MNPTKEFRDHLISQGAALVGIVDLTTQCMKHQQSTPYTSAHPPASSWPPYSPDKYQIPHQ